MKNCQHCHQYPVKKGSARKLCWRCSRWKEIRDKYPTETELKKEKVMTTEIQLPEPTTALSGTLEKIEVMAERYKRGLALHHPDDARGIHEKQNKRKEPSIRCVKDTRRSFRFIHQVKKFPELFETDYKILDSLITINGG